MAHTSPISQRDDTAVLSDIHHLIATYPPLTKDRHALQVTVQKGAVTVSGHVQTPSTRRYFLDKLAQLPGVSAVKSDEFYEDQTLRIEVGKIIPVGVIVARVQYGVVVVSGQLPDGMTEEDLGRHIQTVPGVKRVVTAFGA
jgi:osmotically-inducible protein OsmY